MQGTTIAGLSAATLAAGLFGYAVYFDWQRRHSPDFRRQLRRQNRQQVRAAKEESAARSQAARVDIHRLVDEAKEAGFPMSVTEREQYFMDTVQEGEVLGSDPSKTLECALAFYKCLKVYPAPNELITIYDKTVDKRVLDVLAEMIAYDRELTGLATGGTAKSSGAQGPFGLGDLPTVGLD